MNYKSASDICKICNITTQTLYNWRKSNKIAFKKLNARNILYDLDSIGLFEDKEAKVYSDNEIIDDIIFFIDHFSKKVVSDSKKAELLKIRQSLRSSV